MSGGMKNTNEYTDILPNVKFMLDETDKNVIRKHGTTFHYIKGQLLFAAGDRSEHIYLIEHGWLNIYRVTSDGRQVSVAIRNAGELVGLAETLYGGERACFAQAMENLTVVAVHRREFDEILVTYPTFAVRVAEVLGTRLREAHSVIHEMACCQVPARIALILLKLGEKGGVSLNDSQVINLKLTHEEIAHMVGTSRQTVTSVINSLKNDQSIVCKGREIEKIYPEKLKKWVV